jgi:hypothetical protein
LAIIGEETDEIVKYTNSQRIFETKRLTYQKELETRRTKQGIIEIETELSNYNSKTCNPDQFRLYMIKKIEINDRLMLPYSDPKYRKYQWYGYLNRMRCDNRLIETINHCFATVEERHEQQRETTIRKIQTGEKKRRKTHKRRIKKRRTHQRHEEECEPFSSSLHPSEQTILEHSHLTKVTEREDHITNMKKMNSQLEPRIIIMGDWSIGKQMRHLISTPNIRLKRLLARHFIMYDIDEFRTSCLHYETEERCDNLYLPIMNGQKQKIQKIHSVLTYQMKNNRLGCINRDRNACFNMRKLFKFYMETGGRPDRYTRGYNFD